MKKLETGQLNAPETDVEKMASRIEELEAKNRTLKEENKRLRELSTYDELTGILNRRGGREEIELITADIKPFKKEKRHEKLSERKFSFLLADIDDLKLINDRYGHNIGDVVIKKTAEFLKNSVRKYDIVARWGGEEFLVVCQADAQQAINKFFDKSSKMPQISLDVKTEKGIIKVTLSCGVVDYKAGETLDKAVDKADQALYKSKEEGKNRITKYNDTVK